MVIQARIIKYLLFIQQSSSDLHRWGKTHCDSPVQRKDRSHDERQTYESSIDSIKLNQHPLIKFVPTNFKGAIWFITTYFCHCVISSIGHNNIVQTKWTGKMWDMVTSLTAWSNISWGVTVGTVFPITSIHPFSVYPQMKSSIFWDVCRSWLYDTKVSSSWHCCPCRPSPLSHINPENCPDINQRSCVSEHKCPNQLAQTLNWLYPPAPSYEACNNQLSPCVDRTGHCPENWQRASGRVDDVDTTEYK